MGGKLRGSRLEEWREMTRLQVEGGFEETQRRISGKHKSRQLTLPPTHHSRQHAVIKHCVFFIAAWTAKTDAGGQQAPQGAFGEQLPAAAAATPSARAHQH